MLLVILLLTAGCTVGGEKDLFQMAKLNPGEITTLTVTRSNKTLLVKDAEQLDQIINQISQSSPVISAAGSRISTGKEEDYSIEMLDSAGNLLARFIYDSEKQFIFYTSGKKKYPPYKNETLAEPLSRLFAINRYRAVMNEKTDLPTYFELKGLFDKNKFYGMRGEQLSVWNIESGISETFINDAWSAIISPDQTKAAYNNRLGLFILDFKTLAASRASDPVRSQATGAAVIPAPAVWSPDSRKLLYAVEHEWFADFYIYDLLDGKSTPFPFKNINNFLSKPVAWLKNGDILFIVSDSQSMDGKKEYTSSGYRSNLMLADQDGVFRKLTEMDDFHYVEFAGLTGDESEALVIIHDRYNASRKAALVDLASGKFEELPGDAPVASAGISPDGRFIVLTHPIPDRRGYQITIWDREPGEEIFHYENKDFTPEKIFIWHPTDKKFIFQDRNPENNPPAVVRQILIIPE
jgi:hypothetical protein